VAWSAPGQPSRAVTRWVLTPLAWVAGLAFVLPLVWVIAGSVRPTAEILGATTLAPSLVVPSRVTSDNYAHLVASPFMSGIVNSFIVTALTVSIGLVLCTMAAFSLSVTRYRHRDLLFAVVVISFTVPVDVVAFAMLDLVRGWGFDNTYWALVLPWVADGMAIFLLRQFFLGIPRDLLEASRVDGAGAWTALWRLYVPLSKPALIGAGMILFLDQWTAYLWPLLVAKQANMDLAPVALVKVVQGQFFTDWGEMFAGAVILAGVPALILLPLQRYFTQSITLGGLKE
jgi:putative chitobiose transport system permease protein